MADEGDALRVVFAPDSFKGTATAAEIARALAEGWRAVRPRDELLLRPMADGGEGTLDAIASARAGARRIPVTVTGPDDQAVSACWVKLPDGTGVAELASTSGITLLEELRPLGAHSVGFGQAIAAALDGGVERVVLAIGGSASSDGGAGVLVALGARLLDRDGVPVPRGNVGLGRIARVDLSGLRPLPPGGAVVVSDVTSPLLGEHGAVAVFGPQKGVSGEVARVAEAGLAHFAAQLGAAMTDRVVDPTTSGAGAAGGVGFGLQVWGAELVPGAALVAAEVGLAEALDGADWAVTGEGRYDGQSEQGKVPSLVREAAAAAGARTALVAGAIEAEPVGFGRAESLTVLAGGSAAARAEPVRWARAAGEALARGV